MQKKLVKSIVLSGILILSLRSNETMASSTYNFYFNENGNGAPTVQNINQPAQAQVQQPIQNTTHIDEGLKQPPKKENEWMAIYERAVFNSKNFFDENDLYGFGDINLNRFGLSKKMNKYFWLNGSVVKGEHELAGNASDLYGVKVGLQHYGSADFLGFLGFAGGVGIEYLDGSVNAPYITSDFESVEYDFSSLGVTANLGVRMEFGNINVLALYEFGKNYNKIVSSSSNQSRSGGVLSVGYAF